MDKLDLILNELRKLTDRIGTVESNMATKSHVAEIEARMATKDDIAEIESRMATKDDIAEIESRMATKDDIAEIESKMATKDDIAEIESRMATKDDIAEIEARMATKDDIAEIESKMATKDDIAEIESKMATKDDIAELPYIKQAVLENSQSIAYLSDTLRQVAETVARIEVNHGDKLAALFDAVEVQNDVNEEILEALKRIEGKIDAHDVRLYQLEKA